MPHRIASVLLLTLVPALAPAAMGFQRGDPEREYDLALRKVNQEFCAQHLELALAARKKGLYPQAARELHHCLRRSTSAMVSSALQCRSLMQSRHKSWWQRKPSSRPSASAVASQAKQLAKLQTEDRKARLRLALKAAKDGLGKPALDDVRWILLELGAPLELKGGKLRALGLTLPEDISERLWEEALEIDGQRYLKGEFLLSLDTDEPLFEVSDELLCVRSQRSEEEAQAFHDLARALIPFLQEELACHATRRLNLFLCADRDLYERYLVNTGQTGFQGASGFADAERNTAIVVVDDFLDAAGAKAFALHELTHLFMYEISPTPMPSWYAEGLAEVYGAQGTFTWDGEALTVGGPMPAERIRALLASDERRGLRGMLEEDALDAWNSADGAGVREYYTEAWALLTYLREHAGRGVASKLLEWEVTCRGDGLVGARLPTADEDGVLSANVAPARLRFYQLFEGELQELEVGFNEWLEAYE